MTQERPASKEFETALLALDRSRAERVLGQLQPELTPLQVLESVIVPALASIGDGWEKGEVALSQVYMSGRICEKIVDEMLPPGSAQRKGQPRMAIATLEDYHVLGKRIVYSTLRASGFELLDYGHGIGVDELADNVKSDGIEVLLVSALMLRSALRVKLLADRMRAVAPGAKIIVGGAAFLFDERLWIEVGADAMCRSASGVVDAIASVIGGPT